MDILCARYVPPDYSSEDILRCDGCRKLTHIDLLDGKPNARAIGAFGSLSNCAEHGAEFERLLCSNCYGPGWNPAIEGQQRRNSREWEATRRARKTDAT